MVIILQPVNSRMRLEAECGGGGRAVMLLYHRAGKTVAVNGRCEVVKSRRSTFMSTLVLKPVLQITQRAECFRIHSCPAWCPQAVGLKWRGAAGLKWQFRLTYLAQSMKPRYSFFPEVGVNVCSLVLITTR